MAFFAIRLPKRVLERMGLVELQKQFPSLRFEKPLDLHLTLRFFPNGDEKNIRRIIRATEKFQTAVEAFELTTEGAYTFDQGSKGGVLWLGLKAIPFPLMELQAELEEFAQGLGFAPETRLFTPHITLLRYRAADKPLVRDVISLIQASENFQSSFAVNGFRLMKRKRAGATQDYADILTLLTLPQNPQCETDAAV